MLKNNSSYLYTMAINQYKISSEAEYIDYICADQHESIYTFRQQGGIMRYTAFLDDYTIEI